VRYLYTEEDLTKTFAELGLEEAKLLYNGKKLSGDMLKKLAEVLIEMEGYARQIKLRGVSFENYLLHRKNSILPVYMLIREKKEVFFHSEEELEEYIKRLHQQGDEFVICTDDIDLPERLLQQVPLLHRFPNVQRLQELLRIMEGLGFTLQDYLGSPLEREMVIEIENASLRIPSLRGLVEGLKKLMEKSVDLQRYKGLGEMNPQQLWETTMDPARRRLIRVTIQDAIRADRIFTILMGEEVAPRKDFIQKHALEVKFLDI
jgi:DNA gyrase subunit B